MIPFLSSCCLSMSSMPVTSVLSKGEKQLLILSPQGPWHSMKIPYPQSLITDNILGSENWSKGNLLSFLLFVHSFHPLWWEDRVLSVWCHKFGFIGYHVNGKCHKTKQLIIPSTSPLFFHRIYSAASCPHTMDLLCKTYDWNKKWDSPSLKQS